MDGAVVSKLVALPPQTWLCCLCSAGMVCSFLLLLALAADEPALLALFGLAGRAKRPAVPALAAPVNVKPLTVLLMWVLSPVIFSTMAVFMALPASQPLGTLRPALIAGALSAMLAASLFAQHARRKTELPLALIGLVGFGASALDPPLAPFVFAVAAMLISWPLLRWLTSSGPSAADKLADGGSEVYQGASAFSPFKGSAFLSTFLLACFVEALSAGPNGEPGVRLLQPLWEAIVYYGSPYVTHRYFAGFTATAAYFITCIYFSVLDLAHCDTKVQKSYWPTLQSMWPAFWPQALLYGLGQVVLWSIFFLYPEDYRDKLPAEAPSVWQFGWHMTVYLIAGDFLIYWEHRFMHAVPFLRNNIHSVHHTYTAVFSWAGGWVHPLEDAVVVFCQLATPLAIGWHPLTLWTFAALWVVCLIDEHSGHDVWWSPYQILPCTGYPLGGGAAPHDIHHYKPNKNYSFVFIIWDRLFGTFEAVQPDPYNPYVPPYKLELRSREVPAGNSEKHKEAAPKVECAQN